MLALKGNQGSLLEDVREYFSDEKLLEKCAYKQKVEKARGKIEKREYWQTEDISWLSQKKEWAAYNLNIIRKLALNILKIAEVGRRPLSMKKKRYAIGTNPEKYLDELMNL